MVSPTKADGPNGATQSPPKAVARGVSDVVHDFRSLMELQAQLLRLDVRESLLRMMLTCVLLLAAAIAAVGCFPLVLVALAMLLANSAGLTPAMSFFIAFLVGLITSGTLALAAWAYFRKGICVFKRSREEWMHTVDWIKRMLKPSAPAAAHPHGMHEHQEH
jgi:hypothetical protein